MGPLEHDDGNCESFIGDGPNEDGSPRTQRGARGVALVARRRGRTRAGSDLAGGQLHGRGLASLTTSSTEPGTLGRRSSGSLGDRLTHWVVEAAERRGDVERLHTGADHTGLAAEVSALNAQVIASFSFGLISRTLYGMSHRTVARRQANGDGYVTSAAVLDNGRVSLGLSRVRWRVTTLAGLPVAATLTTSRLNMQTRVVGSRPVHLVARAWVAGTICAGLADRVRRRESCSYHVTRCRRRQRLIGGPRSGRSVHADSLPRSTIGGTGDHGGPGSCRVADTSGRGPGVRGRVDGKDRPTSPGRLIRLHRPPGALVVEPLVALGPQHASGTEDRASRSTRGGSREPKGRQ